MDHHEIIWIKKEENNEVPDEPASMVQDLQPSVNVKKELDEDANEEFVEDPVGISCFHDFMKEEPEVILEVDETKNIVFTSTTDETDSARFIKKDESCGISFEEPNNLVAHEELEESTEESAHASKCGTHIQGLTSGEEIVFDRRLKCCLREQEFSKFHCSFCLQSFTSKYTLIMHVFIHIDNVQPPTFVCKACGEVFPSNVRLKKHLKISEAVQGLYATNNENFGHISEGGVSVKEKTEKKSSCKKPRKISKKLLNDKHRTHTKTHRAEEQDKHDNDETSSTTGNVSDQAVEFTSKNLHRCDVCGKAFTRAYCLKIHGLRHTGVKPYKCDICGKSFTDVGSLKRHGSKHTEKIRNRPHKCDVCGKCFMQARHLKNHSLIHTGIRAHKCELCGKCFIQSNHLKVHLMIHAGIKPYKCDICGKSFTMSGALKRHSVGHTGMKPFKCDICGKNFSLVDSLSRHTAMHSGNGPDRPHKCDVCGKRFIQLRHLENHMLIHAGIKPHKCDVCGKGFTEFPKLKRHTLVHTGQKPHKCDICGKCYADSISLKRHALLHTGLKPYECENCGKCFTEMRILKRHALTHTGMRPQ